MEKLKLNQIGNISSKIIKLIALVVGLSFSERSFSQETIQDLITQTKKYELELSERVATEGSHSFINHHPAAKIINGSVVIEVLYSDEQRKDPNSFLIFKDGSYYWDNNNDGTVDRVYIDKRESTQENPTEEEFNQIKLTMAAPSETEVQLSEMTGKKYTLFDLTTNHIYNTADLTVYKIPQDLKEKVGNNFQEKFNNVLKEEVNR